MLLVQKRMLGVVVLLFSCIVVFTLVFLNDKQHDKKAAQKLQSSKLFKITDSRSIQSITLSSNAGIFWFIRDAHWKIQKPINTPADDQVVDGLLQAALDLAQTSHLDQNDLALFGLQPPRATLSLQDSNGVSTTVLFGKKNSFDGSLYAKVDNTTDIVLIPGSFAMYFEKKLYDFRNKRAAIFNPDDIGEIHVADAKQVLYHIEKENDHYLLTQPVAQAADTAHVDAIVRALANINAKSFPKEEPPSNLNERSWFGLDKPKLSVNLTHKNGDVIRLQFGEIKIGYTTHYFVLNNTANQPVIELDDDTIFKTLTTPIEALKASAPPADHPATEPNEH